MRRSCSPGPGMRRSALESRPTFETLAPRLSLKRVYQSSNRPPWGSDCRENAEVVAGFGVFLRVGLVVGPPTSMWAAGGYSLPAPPPPPPPPAAPPPVADCGRRGSGVLWA